MEKMNQVSVTEFMSKSKEEMYDMAVEMVEKYNRLVERKTVYTNALNKDIADKAAKIDLLEKELEGRKKAFNDLREEMANRYIAIETHNDICKTYEDKVEELKKKNMDDFKRRDAFMTNQAKCICELEKKIKNQKENLDGINKTLEIRTKEKESLIAVKNNQEKEIEAHEEENARLSETIVKLKTELKMQEDLTRNWKNKYVEAQKEIDEWESDTSEYETIIQYQELIDGLKKDLNYWKDQERIRTDQLRATESKVEELYKQIEGLTNNSRTKSTEIARLRKEMEDIKHELSKEDDHGREGFEKYIRYIIAEEEGKFKEELNRKFSEEVSKISRKRTEEELAKMKEETEVKGNGRTSSGRYPWGAKVNDIPCGEDAIE